MPLKFLKSMRQMRRCDKMDISAIRIGLQLSHLNATRMRQMRQNGFSVEKQS